MAKVRLPAIGFWSYVRRDDERSRGRISELREAVLGELCTQIGGDVPVFKDTISIPHGARFDELTRRSLSDATFFIPVLTPNFLQSEWCCREARLFLERERQLLEIHADLPRRSRIFPIHYVEVDEEADTVDEFVRDTLMGLQHLNFHPRRNLNYSAPEVRDLISGFVADIRDLLRVRVEQRTAPPPPMPPLPPPLPPPPPPDAVESQPAAPQGDKSIYWLAGLAGAAFLLMLLLSKNEERSATNNIAINIASNDVYDVSPDEVNQASTDTNAAAYDTYDPTNTSLNEAY